MCLLVSNVEGEIENILAGSTFWLGKKIVRSKALSRMLADKRPHCQAGRFQLEMRIDKRNELGVFGLDLSVHELPWNAALRESGSRKQGYKNGREKQLHLLSDFSTAMNASCGISTLPIDFMRFLPSFCFSRSLRLRVMSPP